jgi:hypothetical protein
MSRLGGLVLLLGLVTSGAAAQAGTLFSRTELHYQRGTLDAPGFAGGGEATTDIFTLQHASAWEHVDLFFFIDRLDDELGDGFNDADTYGELYLGGGLLKLAGKDSGLGPLRDIGWVLGLNAAADAKVRKYLPGIRLYWNAPGFAFLNTDLTAYLDDSRGVGRGGAPRESDSFMFDVSWLYPFVIGEQSFSFTGHAEYIGSRRNQFGNNLSHWILAQPQLRWDAGKALFGVAGRFEVGVEYQLWRNKLGDPGSDESAAQLLVVMGF